MNFLIVCTSAADTGSVTYNCMKILTEHPDIPQSCKFEYFMFHNVSTLNADTLIEKMHNADAIIFTASPAHFAAFAQCQELFETLKSNHVNLQGKPVTCFTTSMRLFETFMHHSLQMMIKSLNGYYMPGLSLGTNDMLRKEINCACISQPDLLPEDVVEQIIANRERAKAMAKAKAGQPNPMGISKGDGEPTVNPMGAPMGSPMGNPMGKSMGGSPLEITLSSEGIQRAVDWFSSLRIQIGLLHNVAAIRKRAIEPALKVAFIYTDDKNFISSNLRGQVDTMQSMLDELNVSYDEIYMSDYNILGCTSCKYCYATPHPEDNPNSSVCPLSSDDFEKFHIKADSYDVIYWVGSLYCGMLSGSSVDGKAISAGFKRYIDRTIEFGFCPKVEERSKSVGFVLDIDNLESFSTFKEWAIADCAFGRKHFLGISTGEYLSDPEALLVNYMYSIYLIKNMKPQINCYSEKTNRHFADLGLHIPKVTPATKPYFEQMHAYEPIHEDQLAEAVTDIKGIKAAAQGRVMRYTQIWQAEQAHKLKQASGSEKADKSDNSDNSNV